MQIQIGSVLVCFLLLSVTFAFLKNVTGFESCFDSDFICGALALSFPKEVDSSPRKTGSKEKGNQKTVLLKLLPAPRLVSSFPRSTPE